MNGYAPRGGTAAVRTPIRRIFSVRLDDDLVEALQRDSVETGATPGAIIRLVLRRHYGRHAGPRETK